MARNKNNNFSDKTKIILASRVGYRCSKPGCDRITCGPDLNNDKRFLNLGEAAHICAASKNGPRYNSSLTSSQISSIDNGIWMCRHHASLIDKDFKNFSVATLKDWKHLAERNAYKLLDEFKLPDSIPETLISIGRHIFFYGSWKSAKEKSWIFLLDTFLKGSFESIIEFSKGFNTLDETEKYIIVQTQGDGDLILEAPEIIRLESGKVEIKLVLADKLERQSLEDIGEDIAIDEDGNFLIENGDLALVSAKKNAFQIIESLLSMEIADDIDDPLLYSHFKEYYKEYSNDYLLINSLLKIEVARLATVPFYDRYAKTSKPLLSFVNRVIEAQIIEHINEKNQVKVNLKVEFSDKSVQEKTIKLYL